MKKFSHSSIDKYSQCSMKYKYHYIDRLRSPKCPSPLFFGSALDDAFSFQLCTKKEDLTEEELTQQLTKTAEQVFVEKMTTTLDVEKNPLLLAKSTLADYYASDFTPELLNKNHLEVLKEFEAHYSLVDYIDFHESCKEQLKAKKKLQNDDQVLFNYLTWLTMVEKGKLMINSYQQLVLPQISKVHSIQEKISIKNEDGDEITGLIDYTATFMDSPDTLHIMDNKSSSKPYEANSVKESFQLATYAEAKKVVHAGYSVIEKKLFKKAAPDIVNSIRSRVIRDVIPEETFVKCFDNYEKVCYNIQAGNFTKNESSCFAFGRVCEFYKLCHYGSSEGLVKLK